MTKSDLLKLHGRKITCWIAGTYISDAKVCVEGKRVYICQNFKNGSSCKDKMGYRYSWWFFPEEKNVTDIKLVEKEKDILDISTYKVGDILVWSKDHRMVLGICGKVVLLSGYNDFKCAGGSWTIEEIREYGYSFEGVKKIETPVEDYLRKYKFPEKRIEELVKIIEEEK